MTLAIYLLVGLAAGLVAGLFGVGGGVIIVPVLVFCFTLLGFEPASLTQLAVGTSLATIVVTAISSIRAHHKMGNVEWLAFRRLTPGLLMGVMLGVMTAGSISGTVLQIAFGVFLLLVALQMGLGLKPEASRDLPSATGLSAAGGLIGYVSALFGIGGGSLTVPYLSWCGVVMQRAVATGAAVGLPIAVMGAITNIWVGWGRESLPELATGFVYWPAVLGIVSTSWLSAKWGARLAQHLPAQRLKQVFSLFLLLIALQFLYRNLV